MMASSSTESMPAFPQSGLGSFELPAVFGEAPGTNAHANGKFYLTKSHSLNFPAFPNEPFLSSVKLCVPPETATLIVAFPLWFSSAKTRREWITKNQPALMV
jgi:hypothetical protein